MKSKFKWPAPFTIDLTNTTHRWRLGLFFIGLILVGLMIVAGGVEAYVWSESPSFCGTSCHPMLAQNLLYHQSPHTNVACADCHIGEGFWAFVDAKLNGMHELYGLVTNTYPRPIKSPVHNLRPARETCEKCHSPSTFKDNIAKTIKHYDEDAANTLEQTTLILKMGGLKSTTGLSKGIHWHISSEVYYIPMDEQRQVMGWVGIKQADGTMKEYFASDLLGMSQKEFVEKARANNEIRRMDCIDCHNRAAHYIPYPEQSVDNAITDGLISAKLPFIRKQAVALLKTKFNTVEEANIAIDKLGTDLKSDKNISSADADQAVKTLKTIYSETNFPDLHLDYKSNPNNTGHTPTLGCFRCHDGKHLTTGVNGKQEIIPVKCNLCHTVPIIGKGSETLVEAPVIVGDVPATHDDFRWTIEHRSVTDAQKQECYQCHGQAFCNNGACHNLSHPEDMSFTHAKEVQRVGQKVCFNCHQDITCTRCHPGGASKLIKP